jgi:uncharacterized protein YifN (PemK superfamily)
MTTPPLPEQIGLHRDRMWRRDEDLRVESAVDAERFSEDVGFLSRSKTCSSFTRSDLIHTVASARLGRTKNKGTVLNGFVGDGFSSNRQQRSFDDDA